MKKLNVKILTFTAILILILTTGCLLTDLVSNYVSERGLGVEKQVKLTLTALAEGMTEATESPPAQAPTAAPQPSATQTEEAGTKTGLITGDLYYPSEGIPPLQIVAFEVENWENYFSKEIYSGRSYQLEVPAGTYFVLAYPLDPGLMGPDFSGAYSQFVLCGLEAGCEDHRLVPVDVLPGETVTGIDLADWYLPPDQSEMWPSNPFLEGVGGIRGNLGYPSEYIPPMRVVAFDVFSQDYYYIDTQRNQVSYEMTGLPPSIYHVVAFVREEGPGLAGGYSYFVTCGMTTNCEDHSLIDVNVSAGESTEGVDPVDFYIEPGEANWPENPTE